MREIIQSAANGGISPSFIESLPADEWVRLPKPGKQLCGLTRSYLFVLCNQCAQCGKQKCKADGHHPYIRSTLFTLPGKARGVRLLYRPSLVALLESIDAAQNGPFQ